MSNRVLASLVSLAVAVTGLAPRSARAQSLPTTSFGEAPPNVSQGVLGPPGQKTAELSTEDMKRVLADRSAVVLDARPFREFAMSHIPGALNVAAKPGVAMSMYVSDVAEIGRLVEGDKERPLVLYCNGPFCGKSNRLADELLAAGHKNVRRYQLGIPVWRALGGLTVTEREGLKHIAANDRTAVFIDTREPAAFVAGSLPGARNLPGAACSKERTWARSRKPRTTAGCPWKTTTPGSS